jgi:parallel beta-helix repeat protein
MKKVVVIFLVLGILLTGCTDVQRAQIDAIAAAASILYSDYQTQTDNKDVQRAQIDVIATAANILYFDYQAQMASTVAPVVTDIPPTSTEMTPINTEIPLNTEIPPTNTEVSPVETEVPPFGTVLAPVDTATPQTSTEVLPAATEVPPMSTEIIPTATAVPPISTEIIPTVTAQPSSTTVPPTATVGIPEAANVKHLYPGGSLRSAINSLASGDTLYVHGGVYTETIDVTKNNVKIIGLDRPKIEQSAVGNWGVLVRLRANQITMSGFEITGSDYMGLILQGIGDVVSDMDVHHNGENGILITGSYSMVENSRIWQNCLSHYNGIVTRQGWASGLSAARRPVGAVIRNNKVFENWGEGLSTYEASETLIEGNEVYDNWSANIYISDAQNITVSGNTVYNTGSMPNGSRVGIMLGDEKYNPASRDIQILNNNVHNTNRNLYYWVGNMGGGLLNVLIRGNTFVDSNAVNNVQISGTNNANVTFEQNTVTQNGSLPIALIGKCNQIVFRGNSWSKTPPCPETN